MVSAGTASLDGSGNFNSGAVGVFAVPGVYTLTTRFSYTGNVVIKNTTVVATVPSVPAPPPCVNPPDVQDSLATYRTGMVLVYTSGYVQRGNTLVRSTKTANATTVNGWYNAIIRRPADPDGLNYWVGRLNSGESVTTLRNEFTAAANNGEIRSYGRVSAVYTFCSYQG